MASKKEKLDDTKADQAMKGWTRVSGPSVQRDSFTRISADAVMPSSEVLKAKYLGSAAPSNVGVSKDSVLVGKPRPPASGPTETVTYESHGIRKSVGVSEGKVVWRQG